MKFLKQQILRVLLYSGVCAAAVTSASAQNATFTLPFEAHWAQVVLEPGTYKIIAPRAVVWPQLLYLVGPDNKTSTVLASFEVPGAAERGGSYLKLIDVGETKYVREFHWVDRAKDFTFAEPKMKSVLANEGGRSITLNVH